MKTLLAITDLTRMQRGRVCVAGYDRAGNCIRPVLPHPGISQFSLHDGKRPIVYPFAVVEYDLLKHTPLPPHTEDHLYDPQRVRFVRALAEEERRHVLERSCFDSVAALFEQPIHTDQGCYVMDQRGPRSLGTIRPARITRAIYEQDPDGGTWDYRLSFVDGAGQSYRLKIVDLTLHYYSDRQHNDNHGESHGPAEIAAALTATLQTCQVYLRIGLARGWYKQPERCYLQLTAVHTFPDYLAGKTFADFAPPMIPPSV
jgi:hypothetical protein